MSYYRLGPGQRQRPAPAFAKATRNASIIAAYLDGASTVALGRRHRISQQRVHQIVSNAGVLRRNRKR